MCYLLKKHSKERYIIIGIEVNKSALQITSGREERAKKQRIKDIHNIYLNKVNLKNGMQVEYTAFNPMYMQEAEKITNWP